MNLTFQSERWAAVEEEIQPLLIKNWRETALDHDLIPLDPNLDLYRSRDLAGQLSVVTARASEELVGYFINFVTPHPHYQSTLFGLMDVYFLDTKYRQAGNGLRLFQAAERDLASRGVREAIANTKVAHDMSAIFERLGWRKTAITFTKIILEAP